MGIPDHLTCLLRNLYAGQEATVRTGHGSTDWLQIGKGVHQGCILSPCLFNLYAEYIIWNARLDEAQAGIKIAERNVNTLRYADDTIFMAKNEELKNFLIKVKEESENVGLKLNIRKLRSWHLVLSLHGKRWRNSGNSGRLYFGGSKITTDGDASHKIKRHLLLGRKAMTNLAAATKLLQSCLTVWPHRRQPTRFLRPWDAPDKNTGVGRHFLLQCMKVKSDSKIAQSCPTLSYPMDCSLPGSSVHGIFQARVLEWGAIAFSMTNLGSILKSRDITLPT